MTPSTFWPEALPWAKEAHAKTGVLTSVILAQWAIETAYGGQDWSPNNNPGNVGSYDGQPVATFPTLAEGVAAYIQTIGLNYYNAVRAATTWEQQAVALGQSPWASAHYESSGGGPGSALIWVIQNYNLTQYDAPTPPPPPPPIPEGAEEMDSVVAPNGDIVSHYRTPNNHLLEVTRKAGTQGAPPNPAGQPENLSVIDITQQYPQFQVVG